MVKHNNQWGTVCDDYLLFSDGAEYHDRSVRAAQSACHTLGFSGGSIETYSGRMSGPVWMDDVACASSETHFLDCSHAGWGIENCGHDEDVLLTCT